MYMHMHIGVERFNKLLREGPLSHAVAHYNSDDHFAKALTHMLELRSEVVSSLAALPSNQAVVQLNQWSRFRWLEPHPTCKPLQTYTARASSSNEPLL